MFERSKSRYLTIGVDEKIPIDIQIFMWEAVDNMPEPKDYLQVFNLTVQNGLQVIRHTSEKPKYEMTYILTSLLTKVVTAKVYIIDDGEHCTMLFASEY